MSSDYKDPRFFEHLEKIGLTEEEYHHRRGTRKHLSKNKKPTNLSPWHQGQTANPEMQAKMKAGIQEWSWKKRKAKEVLESGFGNSKLSDPRIQAQLLNQITDLALAGDKQAMKMLIDMNAIKLPGLKAEEAETTKEEMPVDDALAILKRASGSDE